VDGGYSDNFGAAILKTLIDDIHSVNCQHLSEDVNAQIRDWCLRDPAYVPAAGERWIFPIVIQITSDPQLSSDAPDLCTGPPGPLPKTLLPSPGYLASVAAPLLALYNVRTGIGIDAARQLTLGAVNSIYFHYGLTREVFPKPNDDRERDPSLNWILSPPSRASIEAHLGQCEGLQASMLRRAIEDPNSIPQLRSEIMQRIKDSERRHDDIVGMLGKIIRTARALLGKDQFDSWQKDAEFLWDTDYSMTTPERIEKLLRKYGIFDDYERELVENYRYYLKTGIERQPPRSGTPAGGG